MHKTFLPFLDRQKSIKKLDDVWVQKLKSEAKIASEPTRAVPDPWKADDEMETWDPPSAFDYIGPATGVTEFVKKSYKERPAMKH